LVGINLLREGLDIPEVSLVAILDADKEGFLRSDTSLIQTIGRAARNANGKVIMYADTVTRSMRRAIDETEKRRRVQLAYNEEHNIVPQTIKKKVYDVIDIAVKDADGKVNARKKLPKKDRDKAIEELTREMKECARRLDFERAAYLRDVIADMQKEKKNG